MPKISKKAHVVRKAILLSILAASVYAYFHPDTLLVPVAAHQRQKLDRLFQNHLSTKYFVFHSNLPREKLADFGRTSDQFIDVFNRDFFPIRYKFPLHAYILPDVPGLRKFMQEEMEVKTFPEIFAGAYHARYRAFFTHGNAGWGTFTHEILHPLVDSSLPHVPSWAVEGIPAFAERFYGYEKNGELRVRWGYPSPWRIQELEGRLARLSLEEILGGSGSVSEASLVCIFLYKQGKWKSFLDLVQKNEKNGYPSFLEAALGMPLGAVEPRWREFLNDLERKKQDLYRLPASKIFPTEEEYNEFMIYVNEISN
ncbi:MAG: hypothetical protein NT056_07685 [Proteobacteria bacterium]|nr:hypothetical protein [Pseudomonadota bacterium]